MQIRQSFCKKCYLQQLFSHICLAKLILSCCFAPSVGAQARLEQKSNKESILPNKCARKVVVI